MRTLRIAPALLAVALAASAVQAATGVAVFNFQMTTQTPDWKWLEKCLADQITTDLSRAPGLTLIARDRMQETAEAVQWAPELATTDAKRMDRVRNQLQIEYLVTGVYAVKDTQVEIAAQVVAVATRQEVFRKTVAGDLKDVIVLQKKLSADLYAWFTEGSAEKIFLTLPVWTRSIPAMKALYEGMDLYDLGRYHEAWLYFRGAERTDPKYVEAVYWVAKMYYFMDRYEHARRGFEEFVYLDEEHPRVADAITEYLHTYEKSRDLQPDELLKLYDEFMRRLEKQDPHWYRNPIVVQIEALRMKKWDVLEGLGRYRDALRTEDGWREEFRVIHKLGGVAGESIGKELGTQLKGYSAPKGSTIMTRYMGDYDEVFYYEATPKGPERRELQARGTVVQRQLDRTEYTSRRRAYCWVLPDGYVLKSLTLKPVSRSANGRATFRLTKDEPGDVEVRTVPLEEAAKRGVRFESLPRTTFLEATCEVEIDRPFGDPDDILVELRCDAEFEELGPTGRIEVACADASSFIVKVDDRFGRSRAGLIGLVPTGDHLLTFCPADRKMPYEPWTTKVTVGAGQTVRVVGHLPWNKDSPFVEWAPGVLLAGESLPPPDDGWEQVCVLAEEGGLRAVWTREGDLWSASSVDGRTFSEPHRMELPVSSAWLEHNVRCVRDESGRYVMMFNSTRNARHEDKVYVCWSRDFQHWTAPAIVSVANCQGLSTDDHGRLLLATPVGSGAGRRVHVMTSRDGLNWERLCDLGAAATMSNIIQREDGRLEVYTAAVTKKWDTKTGEGGYPYGSVIRVTRRLSSDGSEWPESEIVGEYEGGVPQLTAARCGGRTVLLVQSKFLLVEQPGAEWRKCVPAVDFLSSPVSLAWHPKWGMMAAWIASDSGPYLVRGPGMSDLPGETFARSNPNLGPKTVTAPKDSEPGEGEVVIRPMESAKTKGHLIYPLALDVKGSEAFKPPKPGAKLAAGAKVVELTSGTLRFHVALDRTNPDFRKPDILRLDFSGKGDFHESYSIPRKRYANEGDSTESIDFFSPRVEIRRDGVVFATAVECWYERKGKDERLDFDLASKAVGLCRFGDKIYRVEIEDWNSNLLYNDVGVDVVDNRRGGKPAYPSDRYFLDVWTSVLYSDRLRVLPAEPEAAQAIRRGKIVDSSFAEPLESRPRSGPGLDQLRPFADHPGLVLSMARGGGPVLVDGAYYTVTVTPDGRHISAKSWEGRTGSVKVDADRWSAWFQGRGGFVFVSGGREPVPLPAGEYLLRQVMLDGNPRDRWQRVIIGYVLAAGGTAPPIMVEEGRVTTLAAGPPVTVGLICEIREDIVRFRATLVDRSGRGVEDEGFGCFAKGTLGVEIKDATGNIVDAPQVLIDDWLDWHRPLKLKGTFTATLKGRPGPIPVKEVKPLTFELR